MLLLVLQSSDNRYDYKARIEKDEFEKVLLIIQTYLGCRIQISDSEEKQIEQASNMPMEQLRIVQLCVRMQLRKRERQRLFNTNVTTISLNLPKERQKGYVSFSESKLLLTQWMVNRI